MHATPYNLMKCFGLCKCTFRFMPFAPIIFVLLKQNIIFKCTKAIKCLQEMCNLSSATV